MNLDRHEVTMKTKGTSGKDLLIFLAAAVSLTLSRLRVRLAHPQLGGMGGQSHKKAQGVFTFGQH